MHHPYPCGHWLHLRVLDRIFQGVFRDCQINTNDHHIGNLLGELGILSENLLCDLGKQSADGDEFHCLILVSPAKIVHILAKGVLVELFRRLGHSFDRRKAVEGHISLGRESQTEGWKGGKSGWKLGVNR
jgi:hypothetical protein